MIAGVITSIVKRDSHSMTKLRSQLRIWWLMVAVAFVAVLLAWLPPEAVVASVGIVLVVLIPVACSPPELRPVVAIWAVALHPVMIPVYLYSAWATAWCVLGHRPRLSLDELNRLGLFVTVPLVMTLLSYLAWPISFFTGFGLAVDGFRRRPFPYLRLIIVPIVWLATIVVLAWDPLQVAAWFFG
jgi:hypothetical protein